MGASRKQQNHTKRRYRAAVRWFVREKMDLAEIATRLDVSKQAVHEMFKKLGIDIKSGGQYARRREARRKRERLRKAQDLAFENKYGMTRSQYTEMQTHWHLGHPPHHRFTTMKKQAMREHPELPFTLRLGEWWKIWQKSGQWEKRGLRRGQYVLARVNREKGHTRTNVVVRLATEQAAIASHRPRPSLRRQRIKTEPTPS